MSMTGVPILVPILTAVAIALALVGVAILVRVIDADWFYRRFVGPATPGTLGALRMLTCVILLVSALWEDLPSTATIPGEFLRPMGIMVAFIYGPLAPITIPLMRSPEALQLFQGLTALLLLLGVLGLWTRVSVPAGAISYLILGGILRQYCWFYHTGLIPIYLLLVLSFLPCGNGWSLDRLRRVARGEASPWPDVQEPVYGWGRYICWLVIALPYVAAGLSKLSKCGIAWCDATNFRSYIYGDTLNPMQFDFGTGLLLRHAPDWMVSLLAASGMFGEILFGLVLFSATARWVLPVIMAMMHLGILFLQNILFYDLILLQTVFYDFSALTRSIGKQLIRTNGPIEVRVNRSDASATQTAAVVQRLDLFRRMTFEDRGAPDTVESSSDLVVLHKNQEYSGDAALRKVARSTPLGWLLMPFMLVPGGPQAICDLIGLPKQKTGDATDGGQQNSSAEDEPRSIETGAERKTWPYAAMTCGLTSLLLLCWAQRVEEYPLTAMQMYTSPNDDGTILYFKYLAMFEDGEIARAPIEDCIGAMRDSRYRRVSGIIAQGERLDVAAEFFKSCGDRYNKNVPPGQRITGFKVEIWQWDYLKNPKNPEFAVQLNEVEFLLGKQSQSDDVSVFTRQATGSQPL